MFSDNCLYLYGYIHNVLANVSYGFLQVLLVKLGSLHRTSNYILVVLGWIISLSVEPGIEPGIFRFQSKVLATPLPSLHSSSNFLLLFLTLLFSLSLSLSLSLPVLLLSFLFHLLSCFCFSPRKTDNKKNLVGFYSRHSTHNPFP